MNQTIIFVGAAILIGILAYFLISKDKQNKLAAAAKAIEEGKLFLENNSKKEGIFTLPSGLQYEILQDAEGPKPTKSSKVKTHYHGTLIDGTVFDSSVKRGQPISFGLDQVIRGWQEGIPLMSIGAKYRFFIPQNLAYGLSSPSSDIPGGSALIFEVELLGIN